MSRERLGSRLGFILLSAGCAIGIGNVWKFPWMVGQNGGGIFVLIYFFFLIILGVPVMTMEFSIGRAAQKSTAQMYKQLEPQGTKWHLQGYSAVAGNYILMMFYTTVAGWMLQYFVSMASGKLNVTASAASEAVHDEMLLDPVTMMLFTFIVIAIGFTVCSFSLQKGLERVTKYMMTALIVIMVVLAVNSCFTEGGAEGLKFYLLPSVSRMKEVGIGNVIVSAMNQAFFTLSLGIGSMAIFGSYLSKDRALLGEAVNISVLDTFVAVTSGLIIFPACMAYDIPVDAGPSLIFVTLPTMFGHLPLGRLWGSLFFVFMSFAALSTVLTVFENIVACFMDMFNWSRKKSCFINGIAMAVLSLPCVFGFNIWSGFTPFGNGSNFMDLEDFLVSNILLPLGSLCYVLFCTTKRGWGWKSFTAEANTGKGLKVAGWMRFYMTFILPLIILVLFVLGLVMKFK